MAHTQASRHRSFHAPASRTCSWISGSRHSILASAQLTRTAATSTGATLHSKFTSTEVSTDKAHKGDSVTPCADPISAKNLELLVDFLQSHRNVLLVTGAGCSTESNIPDYRGPNGAYTTGYKPMTHQHFMATEANQKRYWSRSYVGWHEFSDVKPNGAHEGTARLQQLGWISNVLTQNVDRLHQQAGSTDVLEIHGTTHEVECTACSYTQARPDFQASIRSLNPDAAEYLDDLIQQKQAALAARKRSGGAKQVVHNGDAAKVPVKRPDGDVELADAGDNFTIPPCPECGGALKPGVVFFGGAVPAEVADRATALEADCDAILLLGTSVSTFSVFRLLKAARSSGKRIAAINIGATRADPLLDFKVEALAGEVMMRLATHSNLLMPRL